MDLFYFAIVTILLVAIVALAGCFAKVRADNQRLFLQNLALQEEVRATRSAFKASNDRLVRSHRSETNELGARYRRAVRNYREATSFAEVLENTIKEKQKAIVALCDVLESIALRSPERGKFSRVVAINVLSDEVIIHLKDDSSIVVRF